VLTRLRMKNFQLSVHDYETGCVGIQQLRKIFGNGTEDRQGNRSEYARERPRPCNGAEDHHDCP
jgi:hypothetical protein